LCRYFIEITLGGLPKLFVIQFGITRAWQDSTPRRAAWETASTREKMVRHCTMPLIARLALVFHVHECLASINKLVAGKLLLLEVVESAFN
jgi:hypothetical protein